MKKFKFLLLLLISTVTLVACSDDDDDINQPTTSTIVDVAKANPNFSSLVQALTTTGLDKALENGAASFTVFAPTNQAFADLLAELKLSSLNDVPKETLSNILLYHVIDGSKMASTITTGYYNTLSAGPTADSYLSLNIDMASTMINKRAKITATDVKADNGVIHAIDKVLLPQTIVDVAVTNPSFSVLVAALAKAELVETLKGDGPFTVFAPTDDAFAALFTELGVTGIADLTAEALTPILLAHVVSGNVTSGELSNGEVQTLNADKKILVGTTGGVTIDGDINVVLADVQGTNGVVHVIDKVINPAVEVESNTIVDVAAANDDFSILVSALVKADLAGVLANEDAMFTVFAPTNAAFTALLTELGHASLDDIPVPALTNILLYHVLSGTNMAADISTGYFSTLAEGPSDGTNLSFYVDMTTTTINNRSKITATDVVADNGVIHVIDKVILPQTIVDVAVTNPSFSILVAALAKANLVETLKGDGPFTVFAPTDDAFAALFTELGVTGIADLTAEALTPILLAHVVSGNVTSGELSNGEVQTLNADKKILVGTTGGVTIDGDINVVLADVQGTNGVVHVIDKVIVPAAEIESNTIVDVAAANDDFSILVSALVKADLAGVLANEDAMFTVFAPTNAAFTALLTELGHASLDDIPVPALTNILLYHVLSGTNMAADISTGYFSTLAEGPSDGTNLSFYVDMTTTTINNRSKITATDVVADNGVIHVIDKVILPLSVVDIAVNNPTFSILVAALAKANLVETLKGDGPFTVFAPTNAAFNALFTELGVTGIADLTAEALTPILLSHVVAGNVTSGQLSNGEVQTLNTSKKVMIDISDGVKVNGTSNVVLANVQGSNGVVHVIDKVILP